LNVKYRHILETNNKHLISMNYRFHLKNFSESAREIGNRFVLRFSVECIINFHDFRD